MVLLPLIFDTMDPLDLLEKRLSLPSSEEEFVVNFFPRRQQLRKLQANNRRFHPFRHHWKLDQTKDDKSPKRDQETEFKVSMDVAHFTPEEITVKAVDNTIVVEGKHEEREDDYGLISRQFQRKYQIPEQFDVQQVISSLSSDGVLTIKAPPVTKAIETKERIIPIQHSGPPRSTTAVVTNGSEAEEASSSQENREKSSTL